MKPLYVTSDLHLSAVRSGGTTPATAWRLRQHLLKGFSDILDRCDSDLLINGDFADNYKMIPADILSSYRLLAKWFERGHKVFAVPGNHCLSKSSLDLSSFELLFTLLAAQYPEQVVLLMQPGHVRDGMYAIGHVPNQDLFDAELLKAPAGSYLFLHCNFENFFAVQSDQSLNLTSQQAFKVPFKHVIMGHEHVRREELEGKVRLVGNPFPSSVSDCLNNEQKFMLKITDDGIEYIETWQAEGSFYRPDWRELAAVPADAQFVRVQGEATAAEAAQVVSAISRFRSKHSAFVVSNAVEIDGVSNDEAQMSLESVKTFDVLTELLGMLNEDEAKTIRELIKENNVRVQTAE